MSLLLFGIYRRQMSESLHLPQVDVLAHTVENRNLAQGRRTLLGVEFFNGAEAEEKEATNGSENCAEKSKAEDEPGSERKQPVEIALSRCWKIPHSELAAYTAPSSRQTRIHGGNRRSR